MKPRLSLIIPSRKKMLPPAVLDSIAKHTDSYEVVVQVEGDGFAQKLNKAVARARGDYLVFLHDDCELTEGWADELAEVGAFHLGENNDAFQTWGGYINPEGYCTDPANPPDYAYFCCISKEAMQKIGPFDERYKEPWCQDCDMGMQIKKAGFTYKCLPGKIIHRPSPLSGVPDAKQRGYFERKWNVNR